MKQFICKGRRYGEEPEILFIVAWSYNEAASFAEDYFDDVEFLYEV